MEVVHRTSPTSWVGLTAILSEKRTALPYTQVLEEEDGPMLKHGLQGLHGQKIIVPRRKEWRPGQDLSEARYPQYTEAM